MSKSDIWKSDCRKCQSPVYYYPQKLPFDKIDKSKKKIVHCACTGEKENIKHTLDYTFPDDFIKIK